MIIALTGNKGAGKSTIAEYLVENHGFVEMSFAGPLKEIGQIFGFSWYELYKDKNKKNEFWGICSRDFLQKFGTDVCRELLPKILNIKNKESIWIRLMKKKINEIEKKSKKIVISDVRFLDEAQFAKSINATIVRIERTENNDSHASESEMLQIIPDFTINNKTTKQNLFNQIKQIIN